MKITKAKLDQIIKEEVDKLLSEQVRPGLQPGPWKLGMAPPELPHFTGEPYSAGAMPGPWSDYEDAPQASYDYTGQSLYGQALSPRQSRVAYVKDYHEWEDGGRVGDEPNHVDYGINEVDAELLHSGEGGKYLEDFPLIRQEPF